MGQPRNRPGKTFHGKLEVKCTAGCGPTPATGVAVCNRLKERNGGGSTRQKVAWTQEGQKRSPSVGRGTFILETDEKDSESLIFRILKESWKRARREKQKYLWGPEWGPSSEKGKAPKICYLKKTTGAGWKKGDRMQREEDLL